MLRLPRLGDRLRSVKRDDQCGIEAEREKQTRHEAKQKYRQANSAILLKWFLGWLWLLITTVNEHYGSFSISNKKGNWHSTLCQIVATSNYLPRTRWCEQ